MSRRFRTFALLAFTGSAAWAAPLGLAVGSVALTAALAGCGSDEAENEGEGAVDSGAVTGATGSEAAVEANENPVEESQD